jgi:hypothetical protein
MFPMHSQRAARRANPRPSMQSVTFVLSTDSLVSEPQRERGIKAHRIGDWLKQSNDTGPGFVGNEVARDTRSAALSIAAWIGVAASGL